GRRCRTASGRLPPEVGRARRKGRDEGPVAGGSWLARRAGRRPDGPLREISQAGLSLILAAEIYRLFSLPACVVQSRRITYVWQRKGTPSGRTLPRGSWGSARRSLVRVSSRRTVSYVLRVCGPKWVASTRAHCHREL